MLFNYFRKVFKHLIVLALFLQIIYSNEREAYLSIYQLLAARNLGKRQRGIHNTVQSADMRYHGSGVNSAAVHHGYSLAHIVRVAAARSHYVRGVVMHVIEVELCLKLGVCGACKEVEASVVRQNSIALLNNLSYGRETNYVIIARAAAYIHKLLYRLRTLSGIYIFKLYSQALSMLHGVDALRTL